MKILIRDKKHLARAAEVFLKHFGENRIFAFYGSMGSGKTTIINLLTRFYEINSGSVKIDGTDICEIKKGDLRRQLGLVLQDTFHDPVYGSLSLVNAFYQPNG